MNTLAWTKVPLIDDDRPGVRVASRVTFSFLAGVWSLAAVWALQPVLARTYFFPGLVAVTASALVGGVRYGIATTLLFATGCAWLFLEPRGSLRVASTDELWALAFYTASGVIVAAIAGPLRAFHRQLRAQHDLLSEQHDLLKTLYEQREDLLRALTHDVRSPLNVIAMNAAMLTRAPGDESATRRRALVIQRSVATIDSMLRDLVDVSELEARKVKLERTPIDLFAFVNTTTESLVGTLPVDRVENAVTSDLPPLHADPKRLERVLVNLMSNALKYSPGRVTVEAQPQDGDIVVSVRDEGPGIPAEDLPRLFQKYYRTPGAQKQEGLGLGLYITRLLVEAHGGRVWAESAPGKGSAFHLSIPAAQAALGARGSDRTRAGTAT